LTTAQRELVGEALYRRFPSEELERIANRPLDSALLRELSSLDFSFFAHFYLPRHFSAPDAPFHTEFARDMEHMTSKGDRGYVAQIWARGFAKTTWATLGLPMWAGATAKKEHIILLSDALGQSEDFLETIRHEVADNEALLEDFGDLKGPVWRDDGIILSTGTKIAPYGARQKLRGRKYRAKRPDLVVCDDLEDDISVISEVQRQRLRRWIERVVLKLGSTYTMYVFLGSLLHPDCHMAHLLVNPGFYVRRYPAVNAFAEREDLWARWREFYTDLGDPQRTDTAKAYFLANKVEMLRGTDVAWEHLGYYYLMEDMIVGGRAAFAREMQCKLRSEGEGFFGPLAMYHSEVRGDGEVWLVPHTGAPEVRLQDCIVTGFCDPALGRSHSSSYAAMTTIAKAPHGSVFVIDSLLTHRPTDWVIGYIVDRCRELRYARFGVENVAFQSLFVRDLKKALANAGVEVIVRGVPRPPGANQGKRIESLQPAVDNEWILFHDKQNLLLDQMDDYPDASYKDGPDSLEGAVSLAGGAGQASLVNTGATVISANLHTFGTAGAYHTNRTPSPVPAEPEPKMLIRTEEECYARLTAQS